MATSGAIPRPIRGARSASSRTLPDEHRKNLFGAQLLSLQSLDPTGPRGPVFFLPGDLTAPGTRAIVAATIGSRRTGSHTLPPLHWRDKDMPMLDGLKRISM